MTALCLVELDGAEPADASLRAVTLARSLGTGVGAVLFGGAVPADTLHTWSNRPPSPGTRRGRGRGCWPG